MKSFLWRIVYMGVCIIPYSVPSCTYSFMRTFHDDYPQNIQHTWQLAVWLPSVKCKKYKLGFQTDLNILNMETRSNHYIRNKSSHLRKTPVGSMIILYYSTSYLYRFTTHDHLTIYTMLNIPRTCDQLDGRTRTFTSCMTI